MRLPRTISLSFNVLAATWVFVAPATAQSPKVREDARALAAEGLEAMDAGRHQVAAEKLVSAYVLVKVPTVATNAARALAKCGRWVEALTLYEEAAQLSLPDDLTVEWLERQRAAKRDAQQEREALLARIPRLEVRIEGVNPSTVKVSLDGGEIPSNDVSRRHLLDPGEHTVAAWNADESRTEVVSLAEGDDRVIEIRFGARDGEAAVLATDSASPTAVDVVGLTPASGSRLRAAVPVAAPASGVQRDQPQWLTPPTRRALMLTSFGVGGLGFVVGGITGALAAAKHSDLKERGCTNTVCPSSLDAGEDIDSLNTLRWVSTTGFVIGALGAAGGLTLWLTEPRPAGELGVGLGPGTATFFGAF